MNDSQQSEQCLERVQTGLCEQVLWMTTQDIQHEGVGLFLVSTILP